MADDSQYDVHLCGSVHMIYKTQCSYRGVERFKYFYQLIRKPQSDALRQDPYYEIQLEYMKLNIDTGV